jgi:hypothetical protein
VINHLNKTIVTSDCATLVKEVRSTQEKKLRLFITFTKDFLERNEKKKHVSLQTLNPFLRLFVVVFFLCFSLALPSTLISSKWPTPPPRS